MSDPGAIAGPVAVFVLIFGVSCLFSAVVGWVLDRAGFAADR